MIASIAAKLPTTAPFPEALDLVSSIYGYLGSIASSQLKGQTTITAPAGWTLPPLDTNAVPQPTGGAPAASTTTPAVSASECPARRMVSSVVTSGTTGTQQPQMVNGAIGLNVPTSLVVMAGVLGVGLFNLA